MAEERDIAEELAGLTQATHDLVETLVKPAAHDEAVRVARITSETWRLRRLNQLWLTVLGVTVAILLSVALTDVHVHRSHIAPLEGATGTADTLPMWPSAQSVGTPVGPALLFVGLLVILASLGGYLRTNRRLTEQERRERDELERPLVDELKP